MNLMDSHHLGCVVRLACISVVQMICPGFGPPKVLEIFTLLTPHTWLTIVKLRLCTRDGHYGLYFGGFLSESARVNLSQ